VKDGRQFSETCTNKAAVILTTRNRLEMTKEAIKHLYKSGDTDLFNLYIVDSCSTDGTAQWLFSNMRNKATLIFDHSPDLGYAEANNRIMKMCRSYKYIYLINNDVYVEPHWLSEAIKCAEKHPEAGHIASKQLRADYSIQAAGAFKLRDGQTVCAYATKPRHYEPAEEEYECDYGGFGLYLNSTIEKIGYLEERFWPIYFDDDDYCLRVEQAGMKVVYCPKSELRHMMEPTNREHHSQALQGNLKVFQEKFGEYLKERPLKVRKGASDASPGGIVPDEWY